MKLSMMTLGCPTWDLVSVCQKAKAFGYDGIDFRGIGDVLDVTLLPAFTTEVASTVRLLADHGLVASGISSSIRVCDRERRDQSIDEARRTIAVARAIGARNVRVFGEGNPTQDGYAKCAAFGADCVRAILELPGASELSWNFETHDHWISSADCKRLLDAVRDAAFGAAWDICHTRRIGGESATQTLDALGDRLRYVHIKDAARSTGPTAVHDGWHYVLPGRGEVGLDEAARELQRRGYDGWLMFEHEKRWHPELEEPDVALPAFVRWADHLGLR